MSIPLLGSVDDGSEAVSGIPGVSHLLWLFSNVQGSHVETRGSELGTPQKERTKAESPTSLL